MRRGLPWFSLLVFLAAFPPAAARAGDAGSFGTARQTVFALTGKVYAIPEGTDRLPDFSRLQPVGTVWATTLNVPPRRFSDGFPGVTDRFEWFAIDYRGRFRFPEDREVTFWLLSDDGSRLLIDGRVVVDNDGVHPPREARGSVFLRKGEHEIEVQYFQGPRWQVALVLSWDGPEPGKKVPFDSRAFAPVEIEEGNCEVTLRLGSGILFDFDRADLRPEARRVLGDVAGEIRRLDWRTVVVEGHTDDRGTEAYNLDLSRRRARAVADWLAAHGFPRDRIEVVGRGETAPIVPNDSEEHRARNRRVEIRVKLRCGNGGASAGPGAAGSAAGEAAAGPASGDAAAGSGGWRPPPTTPVPRSPVGVLDPDHLGSVLPAWEEAVRSWKPDPAVVRTLREAGPARVEIFFGSWCGDSAAHVPPLLAALRAAANPRLRVVLVALDRGKHEPGGRARARRIERVPTVIVLRNGREIGRIVETPRTTMDRDVAELLAP